MRKGIARFLKSQREKKKAKKANKFKPNSRRLSPRYSNDSAAFLLWAAASSAVSQAVPGEAAIVQGTRPPLAAMPATLGNASWFSYLRREPSCPPLSQVKLVKDPSNEVWYWGSVSVRWCWWSWFYWCIWLQKRWGDRGFFSRAVCSRSYCCPDEAWWFSNLPLSSSKPKQQFFAEKTATAWDFQPSGLLLCFLECHKLGKVRFFWGGGGSGYFRIVCEKSRGLPTSWNRLMHDPSEIPKQKHLTLPPYLSKTKITGSENNKLEVLLI